MLQRVDAATRHVAIHAALTGETRAWSISPLIGHAGDWIEAAPDDATILLERLAETVAADNEWLAIDAVTRLRTLPLSFYPDARLCEGQARTLDDADALLTFIALPDRCILLKGNAAPIHDLNVATGMNLRTPGLVADYIRFFSAAIQGENGPFLHVDYADLMYDRPVTEKERYRLDGMEPDEPVFKVDDALWTWTNHVLHGGYLYQCNYQLQPSGQIKMSDDMPAQGLAQFPVRIFAFWGNVRRDLTQQCRAAAEAERT